MYHSISRLVPQDRNSISTARDNGLVRDLNLTDQQYQTALSILFVGYITFQIPSNLLMTRIGRPSLYIPTFVALWGIVSGCTAATRGYHSLLAVRICLGVVEAPFFPGALALLGYFYKKEEMATRTALLFSGSIISNAFSGLISAGILKGMQGKAGLTSWHWLFILEVSSLALSKKPRMHRLADLCENTCENTYKPSYYCHSC